MTQEIVLEKETENSAETILYHLAKWTKEEIKSVREGIDK